MHKLTNIRFAHRATRANLLTGNLCHPGRGWRRRAFARWICLGPRNDFKWLFAYKFVSTKCLSKRERKHRWMASWTFSSGMSHLRFLASLFATGELMKWCKQSDLPLTENASLQLTRTVQTLKLLRSMEHRLNMLKELMVMFQSSIQVHCERVTSAVGVSSSAYAQKLDE